MPLLFKVGPQLQVFLRCGQLAIYQALPAEPSSEPIPPSRTSTLTVKFVKTFSRAFELQHPEEQETSALAEHRRILRQFIPFTTSPAPDKTMSGVFLTGENPSWILQTDKSSVKVIPSGHAVVHAFTGTSLWGWKGDFLLYSDEVRADGRVCQMAIFNLLRLVRARRYSNGCQMLT